MFYIKGDNPEKDAIQSILSSAGMNKAESIRTASILFLLNRYGSLLPTELSSVTTINRLAGASKEALTEKYTFMKLLKTLHSPLALPACLFYRFDESTIQTCMNRGTKHKFLKASDGFAGSGNKVVDSVEEVKEFVEQYKPTKEFKGWILQDALEMTATIQGYKFHLRIILVAVVRARKTSIYISRYHTFVLSGSKYDVGRLKEEEIYNTHKKRNTQNMFFPMERPDGWTIEDAQTGMNAITRHLQSIFKHHHMFQPDWKVKNGYELLGVDILFDQKHHPYILEINQKMAFYPSQTIFLPEVLHLGLGGAPMKLFKSLYGSLIHERTPLQSSLSSFYGRQYSSVSEVHHTFQTLFHTKLEEEGDRAYYLYQKPTKRHTRRAKSKARGSKTLKRGSIR